MRLERLTLGGFNHFISKFELDLTTLPDGLIAIVGPNGAGKTTALDAAIASLYGPGVANKAFPSREGTLFTYATSREAFIETDWDLDARGRVRCRVNVDGPKRKAEAVLQEPNLVGTWLPVNNGQTSSYKDAVAERFPSLRSLLASAYASQNKRGGFGELGQKERLELFVELADLAYLEARSLTAKRCQQVADGIAARIRSAIDVLGRDVTPQAVDALGNRLTAIAAELETARRVQAQRTDRIATFESERMTLAANAERYAEARATAEHLTSAVGRAQAAIESQKYAAIDFEQAHKRELQAIAGRYTWTVSGIEKRQAAATAAYDAATKDRTERIENNRLVLRRAVEIQRAAQDFAQAETEIALAREQEVAHDDARAAADKAAREISLQLSSLDATKRELASARERGSLIETVKFGTSCAVDPACPLITDAASARSRVPVLEAALAIEPALRDQLTGFTAASVDAQESLTEAASRRAEWEKIRTKVRADAALLPSVEHAQARIDEYLADGAKADAAQQALLASFAVELSHAETMQTDETTAELGRATAKRAEIDADVKRLVADVVALQQQTETARKDVAALDGAKRALDEHDATTRDERRLLSDAETRVATLAAERTALDARKRELDDKRSRVVTLQSRLTVVENEMLGWQTVARACGRDGLQRLEIDAAGPVVSDLANDLLSVGYGTRFSIEIVTQVSTADGKDVKEKFTILAIDNEHGGEPRDIGDLSGGERVIVEEAIRAALSCYVNLRSRTRIRTLWRDETTGALYPETAPLYVAMLRRLREMSGAEQVLFITHNPDCAALADAQVHVKDGEATVVLPPYRAAIAA